MKNSGSIERLCLVVTAVVCLAVALSMLLLEEQSLVSDLVYAGF
jgi:hypothetical protein